MSETIEDLIQRQRQLFNRIAIGMTTVACASGAYLATNPPSFEGGADCESTELAVEYDLDEDDWEWCHGGKEVASIETAGVSAALAATLGLSVASAAIVMRPRKKEIIQASAGSEVSWPSAN